MMTVERQVEIANASLAEQGWPPVFHPDPDDPEMSCWAQPVPKSMLYMAWLTVLPVGMPCWPCYRDGHPKAGDCIDGNCHHPDEPRLPPRELIVRGPGR